MGTTARHPSPSPPTPLLRPAGHRGAGPPAPPGQGGRPPFPRDDRGARGGGRCRARTPRASKPAPPAPTRTATGTRTRAGAQGRHTDHTRGQHANTNRSSMGATPSLARAMPMTPALWPAQGRQRDGPRQGAQAAPPNPPPPPWLRSPAPREAHSPKPGRKEMGLGRPPPKNKPNRARDRGRTSGGARTAWNGPTGAEHRDRARCARYADKEWGEGDLESASARAHAHAKDTRGILEGQPDGARGMHRPHGMAYQRARIRDTWTGRSATHSVGTAGRRGGGTGMTQSPAPAPTPPKPAASAARTQPGHCTHQGSSGTPRHGPTPRLGSLRASPRGSRWRQASRTGPAAPAARATAH